MKSYGAKPAIGKKVTGGYTGGSGVGKRSKNRIYKKNTGTSSVTRARNLRKHK